MTEWLAVLLVVTRSNRVLTGQRETPTRNRPTWMSLLLVLLMCDHFDSHKLFHAICTGISGIVFSLCDKYIININIPSLLYYGLYIVLLSLSWYFIFIMSTWLLQFCLHIFESMGHGGLCKVYIYLVIYYISISCIYTFYRNHFATSFESSINFCDCISRIWVSRVCY